MMRSEIDEYAEVEMADAEKDLSEENRKATLMLELMHQVAFLQAWTNSLDSK
jgi:hypothetical protein